MDFAKVTRTSNGQNVRTVLAQIKIYGDAGDDQNAETVDDAEVLHTVGFVARPPITPTLEALIERDGDDFVVLCFADKTDTLHDVEEGASEVYSPKEPSCRIRMRASGDIEITAKSGQNIILNGGTKSIGRVDDQVQVTIPAGTFLTAASGGVMNASAVTVTGKINAGANNVKA